MSDSSRVEIETEAGVIVVVVDPVNAPITAANFLHYVDHGFYDGGRFWRTVTLENQPDSDVLIEVIQGGVNPERAGEVGSPIKLERTTNTGLSHLDGTVSMGRFAPDSAHSEFFICIGDQPELNFGGRRNPDGQGFAAFGQVVAGMDIVRKIHRHPSEKQRITQPAMIIRMRRV